jgi:NAD(P)H-dependent FMN reductase
MKKLLIVSGSPKTLAEGSKTYQACLFAKKMAEAASNFEVDFLSLGDNPLPTARPEWHRNPLADDVPEEVREVALKFKDAECVILATPIYHGSYTSHIKNMIDAFNYDFLRGRNVGIITIGHGGIAVLPATHLQDVIRTAYGQLCHTICCFDGVDDFDQSGKLIESERITNRMRTLIREL